MSYEMKTTFWQDFTIADAFGEDAVKDTFKRAFGEWKHNVVYVTELVLVMNWKCWDHYHVDNKDLGKLYCDLYFEARDWCLDHLRGADFDYFWRTTD